jgi:hypothetical protein
MLAPESSRWGDARAAAGMFDWITLDRESVQEI